MSIFPAGGYIQTFSLLLRRGAKLSAAANGASILMEAVDKRRLDFLDFLLDRAPSLGIDLNHKDAEGNNVLFYAASTGNSAIFLKLLHAGCAVESDFHNRNLVMQACLNGHVNLVEFLLNNREPLGVDTRQKDKDGRNALFYW